MKLNDIFVDVYNLNASGLARGLVILKKNGNLRLFLPHKEIITKGALNNHQKRLFSLFEKRFQYLRSINKDMKKNQINWGKAELMVRSQICNKEVHFFFYEELVQGSDYMVFKPFLAYDKDIIVSINVFNSLEVSF